MLRQVSSRNHRAKGGFRAKNALQISTLVAVGIWLIYQMKYSHDHRKAYEDKLNINARQSELTSFGRKDLFPFTGKEEAKHGEIKEKVREAEHSEQKSQISQKVDRHGKKWSSPDDQEHEEHSREAREESFWGDDASSEVVHNTQEAERDERTREARERSFKADDASSAVDHVVPLKDSEPEIGMFVSVREKNASLVRFNQTLPGSRATANETTLEDEHASSVRTDESGEQPSPSESETLDRIYNETGVLKFHANESQSQAELGLRLRENAQKHSTVIPKISTQTQSNQTTVVVDPTIVARDLQNLTAVPVHPPLQASTEAAKLEVPNTKNEVMAKKPDDQNPKTAAVPEDRREKHHNLPNSFDTESKK